MQVRGAVGWRLEVMRLQMISSRHCEDNESPKKDLPMHPPASTSPKITVSPPQLQESRQEAGWAVLSVVVEANQIMYILQYNIRQKRYMISLYTGSCNTTHGHQSVKKIAR